MEAQSSSGKEFHQVVIVGPSGDGAKVPDRTTIMQKLVEIAAEMGNASNGRMEIDLSNVEFVEDINVVTPPQPPHLEASIFDSAYQSQTIWPASKMLTLEHFLGYQKENCKSKRNFNDTTSKACCQSSFLVKDAIRKAKAEMRRLYRSGQVT